MLKRHVYILNALVAPRYTLRAESAEDKALRAEYQAAALPWGMFNDKADKDEFPEKAADTPLEGDWGLKKLLRLRLHLQKPEADGKLRATLDDLIPEIEEAVMKYAREYTLYVR
jgi:hypothetical protein